MKSDRVLYGIDTRHNATIRLIEVMINRWSKFLFKTLVYMYIYIPYTPVYGMYVTSCVACAYTCVACRFTNI